MDKVSIDQECKDYFAKNDLVLEKVIGSGSFGVVVLVTGKDQRKLAIKIFKELDSYEKEKVNIDVLLGLDYEIAHLVKYHSCVRGENFGYIFMDYYDLKTLDQYIIQSEKTLKIVAKQLLSTIQVLHQLNIVHRDIKTPNILFDELNNSIVLLDLGCSKHLEEGKKHFKTYDGVGTAWFNAPEFDKKPRTKMNKKVDIFSIGRTLQDMAAMMAIKLGKDEMAYKRKNKLISKMPKTLSSFITDKNDIDILSYEFQNFIQKCLVNDSGIRYDINSLLDHHIFTGYSDHNIDSAASNNNGEEVSFDLSNLKPFIISNLEKQIPKVRAIQFDNSFNSPLSVGVIPDSVKVIIFGDSFNQILSPEIIPNSVKTIKFGNSFNQPIVAETFPESTNTILFGHSFNQPIDKNVIPEFVKTIIFGDSFNHSIENLPDGIIDLKFGGSFNCELTELSELEYLVLGNGFKKINYDLLPNTLKRLVYHGEIDVKLGLKQISNVVDLTLSNYNKVIDANVFSNGLIFLRLGNNQTLETIQSFKNIPSTITDLSFGCSEDVFKEIKYKMLPIKFDYGGSKYSTALTYLSITTEKSVYIIDLNVDPTIDLDINLKILHCFDKLEKMINKLII
ncbi:hypothetical protein ACTFIU_008018 [Dictyostelium citrinum]